VPRLKHTVLGLEVFGERFLLPGEPCSEYDGWKLDQHPGAHATDTVDCAIVLSGEIYSVIDESETLLKAGDILIQCGTNHGWSNRSNDFARIAFVLIDGKR